MKTNVQAEAYFPGVTLPPQPLRSHQTHYKALMSRLYYSSACKIFYTIMIILTTTCIIWTLLNTGTYPIEGWFVALEVILIVLLTAELIFRVFMQGLKIFIKDFENIIDIFVALISIAGVFVGFELHDELADMEESLSMFILLLRTSTNYLRLAIFVKNMRNTAVSEISLTHISPSKSSEKIEMNKPVSKYIMERKNSKEFSTLSDEISIED
ncbi:unnamed protein product [Blepharisma stoltei]|uniref:Ion transport domain-containing protein n=1 Tax=Blepharisma stoltei TaxID=1481888 RepID=A0AAU9JJM6_9CILI|nr:unnamed protein product [Blepharisma stoltei]